MIGPNVTLVKCYPQSEIKIQDTRINVEEIFALRYASVGNRFLTSASHVT